MTAIARYRQTSAPALLSAGFRPFFLLSGLYAAAAVPLWLLMLAGRADLPLTFQPVLWHAHEMVFGYGAATVAGFLLTAVPNWTGRMPLQGLPLAVLVLLWMAGRAAMLLSGLPAAVCMVLDLAFPAVFLAAIAREILAGRNWRNIPVLAALGLLLVANLLTHLGASTSLDLAMTGNRLGIATLTALISLVGGRIIPSFTRNWLAKRTPDGRFPVPFGVIDRVALGATVCALALWVALPFGLVTSVMLVTAGVLTAVRLARWRGVATRSEPLLLVLHVGYAWVAIGLLLLGASHWMAALPPQAALHALTVGAIGTMPLAVMARATLGHTGHPLTAGPGCAAAFVLVTLAAVLRLTAPIMTTDYAVLLDLAGTAWSCGFGLFVLLFARLLLTPRRRAAQAS